MCEGKNTEPLYFKGLIEDLEHQMASYSFHVVVHDTPKTNPIGLIEEARKLMVLPEDEAWVVYDKDGYTKHDEAYLLASQGPKRVNIAFSSIAFEQWVLLHFERSEKAYPKSNNVIDHLRNRNFVRNYSKKAHFHLYPKLKKRTHIALENAAWLRHEMYYHLQENKGRFYAVNPYTTIDKLVAKLLGIHEKVIWVNAKEDIYTNNLTLSVQGSIQTGNSISVDLQIINKKPAAFVLNKQADEVYILDKHHHKIWPIHNEKLLISQSETFWFSFAFPLTGPPEKYLFCIEIERTKCIVQL